MIESKQSGDRQARSKMVKHWMRRA